MKTYLRNSKLWKWIRKIHWLHHICSSSITYFENAYRLHGMHKHGNDALKKLIKAIHDKDFICFAAFGTLLGFVREGKSIENDCDLDFGILETNTFDWNEFKVNLTNNGFFLHHWYESNNKILEMCFAYKKAKSVRIDFFLFTTNGDVQKAYSSYRLDDQTYESENQHNLREITFPKITELKNVYVNGVDVKIPINAEEILEACYTKEWRIPDPYWTYKKMPNAIFLLDKFSYRKQP